LAIYKYEVDIFLAFTKMILTYFTKCKIKEQKGKRNAFENCAKLLYFDSALSLEISTFSKGK
jgi:hypothetical protein